MLLFAYGSNMCTARLRARVASANPIDIGHATERRLAFHKRGADGSAKADAPYTGRETDVVWGVVFEIVEADFATLDQHEPSYDRREVSIVTTSRTIVAATYEAHPIVVDPDLVPFGWYRNLVLAGAIEHGLPSNYVRAIRDVVIRADSDVERVARHAELLRDR